MYHHQEQREQQEAGWEGGPMKVRGAEMQYDISPNPHQYTPPSIVRRTSIPKQTGMMVTNAKVLRKCTVV